MESFLLQQSKPSRMRDRNQDFFFQDFFGFVVGQNQLVEAGVAGGQLFAVGGFRNDHF